MVHLGFIERIPDRHMRKAVECIFLQIVLKLASETANNGQNNLFGDSTLQRPNLRGCHLPAKHGFPRSAQRPAQP